MVSFVVGSSELRGCSYQFRDGSRCLEPVFSDSLCILHVALPEEYSLDFARINSLKETRVKEKAANNDWNFEGAQLTSVDLRDVSAKGDVLFDDASIQEEALFDGATIDGYLSFIGASIGQAWFAEARIRGYVLFEEATVRGNALFNRAIIGNHVSFVRGTIRQDVVFDTATIQGVVTFDEARIEGNALFRGATIELHMIFTRAIIQGNVSLNRAAVGRDVTFRETKIGSFASFDGARIGGGFQFDGAIIQQGGGASFEGTAITGPFSLEGAKFPDYATEELVYRAAKRNARSRGATSDANRYYYLEMVARRRQKKEPFKSLDLIPQYATGYGRYPRRMFLVWIIFALACGWILFLVSGQMGNMAVGFLGAFVTGYALLHIQPGLFGAIVVIETLINTFLWGVFIAIFSRLYIE